MFTILICTFKIQTIFTPNPDHLQVINTHTRLLKAPKSEVLLLFRTLATPDDRIWPTDKWPAMRFREGLIPGAKGGHGPIRYSVVEYDPNGYVCFSFRKPRGFHGTHALLLESEQDSNTRITHTIDMQVRGIGIFTWNIVFRWLHDALIEDAFDKVERQVDPESAPASAYSPWVQCLRWILRPGK